MIERLLCFLVSNLCCLLYGKAYRRHIHIKDMEALQKEVLLSILKKNKSCTYGLRYHFKDIHDMRDYQSQVPLTRYEDYESELIMLQEEGVNPLFCEPIELFEMTSGSTSATKLIPYNQSLKSDFQKGIKPWIYNLYTSYKGIKWGKSYWSITPVTTQKSYTKSGIAIGFEEDTAYFGKLERKLQNCLFAVPNAVSQLQDMAIFYEETAFYLLKCKHLTLISIWNPTYLLLLLEYMKAHQDRLVTRIALVNKKRSGEVAKILREEAYPQLWQQLKVISCWCDANAAPYAKKVQLIFPQATVQPKGLLATECFVSFPFAGEEGAQLSVHSHFFEFIAQEDGQIYLAHQLKKDQLYAVVVTTSGGLYRYQLGDVVLVVGFSKDIPRLKFQGKLDKVSDLFGEKLSEGFIKSVLQKLDIQSEFCMVAPEVDCYVLYIKAEVMPVGVEEALRESFHYDYCRKLGQLKALKIFKLSGNPEQEYLQACVARGQRLGDIKPTLLYPWRGLDQIFKGAYQ